MSNTPLTPSYKAYSGTTIRPEKTQADISKELTKYGIWNIQHTTIEQGFSVAFQAVVADQQKPLTIRIDIPYDHSKDYEDRKTMDYSPDTYDFIIDKYIAELERESDE